MELVNKYFPILDNFGFVALKGVFGGDEDIETAARTSYAKGTRTISDTRNLIRYLLRHNHTSPLEFVQFKFHVSCPIFVSRQWIRHRMSSTNELSGRYSELPECNYYPQQENMTLQAKNNKQGRNSEQLDDITFYEHDSAISANTNEAWYIYRNMLDDGIAKELARIHLPLSTYTEFYWSIDLHNLLHFLKLRCDSHAQFEIRQYANVIAGIVKECCPLAFEAWYDYKYKSFNWTRLDQILFNKCKTEILANKDYEKSVSTIGESIGMSKREVAEFIEKLQIPTEQDFTLNLSTAKTAEHYQQIRLGISDANQTCSNTGQS